jgi:peptidoglycan DL-endopeptidase CwlO
MRKMSFAVCLLLCLTFLPVRGEEDGLNKVYRSLSTFGNKVRNTFTEEGGDSGARTEARSAKRHRQSGTKHQSSKKMAAKRSDSEDESRLESGTSKKVTKSAKVPSEQAKENGSQGAAKKDKPHSKAAKQPLRPESTSAPVAEATSDDKAETAAPMATLEPEALRDFSKQPFEVQRLIRNGLALTEQNLSYKYGSANPAEGGMDCSGFIYYLLKSEGYKDVPRDSAEQYAWARKNSDFHAVLSRSADSFELDDLRPGDLLFWSGTYKVDRDIPITHVMIYLGKEKSSGKRVMLGATDGRTYDGVRRYGVSVFDFKMPSGKPSNADPDLTTRFEGYARIPELGQAGTSAKPHFKLEQESRSDTVKVKRRTKASAGGD